MIVSGSAETHLLAYTIGHSTRSVDEFFSLLRAVDINLVVDVRAVSHSRHNPNFNKEILSSALKGIGVKYIHKPELGGLRRPKPDSVNLALKSKSFRGYADYMQTKEFAENLLKLVALIKENCVAIMCAEAIPWRCHRNLLSDALVVRRIKVKHILTEDSVTTHELAPIAYVEGTRVSYPLFARKKSQRALTDFGVSP